MRGSAGPLGLAGQGSGGLQVAHWALMCSESLSSPGGQCPGHVLVTGPNCKNSFALPVAQDSWAGLEHAVGHRDANAAGQCTTPTAGRRGEQTMPWTTDDKRL